MYFDLIKAKSSGYAEYERVVRYTRGIGVVILGEIHIEDVGAAMRNGIVMPIKANKGCIAIPSSLLKNIRTGSSYEDIGYTGQFIFMDGKLVLQRCEACKNKLKCMVKPFVYRRGPDCDFEMDKKCEFDYRSLEEYLSENHALELICLLRQE